MPRKPRIHAPDGVYTLFCGETIDQFGQFDQLMTPINQVFQTMTKQIFVRGIGGGLGFHFYFRICQIRFAILPFSGGSYPL